MVGYVVGFLGEKGFKDIKADISGYSQPTKIKWKSTGSGHIPDVIAKNGRLTILEVETDDSIFDQHTADQWKLFAVYAQERDAEFWVVVPTGSEPDARVRLTQLGISASVWTV